jgi:hypothetical protein
MAERRHGHVTDVGPLTLLSSSSSSPPTVLRENTRSIEHLIGPTRDTGCPSDGSLVSSFDDRVAFVDAARLRCSGCQAAGPSRPRCEGVWSSIEADARSSGGRHR